MSKTFRGLITIALVVTAVTVAALPVCGQGLSRWALGRPSLLIDMPGDPSAGGVAWADRSIYSIFPNSWSAEGGGVRIEVARLYSTKNPSDLLAEISQKANTPMAATGRGQISGRDFVNSIGQTRMAAVIGHDGGVLGGASWVVMAAYKDQAGQALASAIFNSIKVEREGNRHWALRSLGPTFLAAELPFELTAVTDNKEGRNDWESSFDGMNVRVSTEVPSPGAVFEKENTLKSFVESDRTRPGVTDFTFTREKYKLGDKDGDLITKTFKRGGRSYRIYEFAFIEKRSALTASIQIDPNRTDHQLTTERILRTFRTTITSIYGWKTYSIGNSGLFVDLPVAPGPPKTMGSVQVYESNTPLAMTQIRELTVGFPTAHDPDFSAKQYFEMQQALAPDQKLELQGIEKLLIDGLEARLVKATWRNGQNVNQRQILTIYGYETQWIVDMLASKETELYMERVMQSVRVKIDSGNQIRQSFGTMGVSFIVGDKRLEPKVTENPNDPDFSREELATAMFGSSILAVYEMVLKTEPPPMTDERLKVYLDGFLRGVANGAGIQLSAKQRDSFPINIDGIEGRHIIYNITASVMKPGAVIQADFVVLGQGRKLWTAIVITNFEGGMAARIGRARILNSLRVGI